MLALCVNMTYSLARWRFLKPQPPFELAGQAVVLGPRIFLSDAVGSLELLGTSAGVRPGDLISVRVESLDAINHDRIHISECRVLSSQKREWHPKVGRDAQAFSGFLEQVRQFFLNKGFEQVHTPTLVTCPGLEPSLEPFVAERMQGSKRTEVFLPTSPEIHLKKALSLGWTDIFEIKTCFRNNENSPHHAEEFHMLEWYRAFADLDLVIEDLRGLVAGFTSEKVAITTFQALFEKHFAFRLAPDTRLEDLQQLCRREKIEFSENDTFNDVFHRVMLEKLEPAIASMGPLIIRDFPPSMAALAKLTSEGWADRFEFYWRGFEIANAFNEVTDPKEQEERWRIESEERERLGTRFVPQDSELLRALERGLPPTGGIAMGLERLYMATHQISNIGELSIFSSSPNP